MQRPSKVSALGTPETPDPVGPSARPSSLPKGKSMTPRFSYMPVHASASFIVRNHPVYINYCEGPRKVQGGVAQCRHPSVIQASRRAERVERIVLVARDGVATTVIKLAPSRIGA